MFSYFLRVLIITTPKFLSLTIHCAWTGHRVSMHITFHSDDGNAYDSSTYSDLSSAILESMLHGLRAMNISIESELMKRDQRRKSDQRGQTGICCERLHHTVRELVVRERLDGQAAKNVEDGVKCLTTSHLNSSSRIYQAFLFDVLNHCDVGVALLCAASLCKKRISNLGSKDRVGLLA